MAAADPLSTTFAALADPTRRAILARLAQGDATVGELAKPFAMTLPGVSKHLRVLRDAGLVVQGRDAPWRPCRLDFRVGGTWHYCMEGPDGPRDGASRSSRRSSRPSGSLRSTPSPTRRGT